MPVSYPVGINIIKTKWVFDLEVDGNRSLIKQ